MKSGLARFPVGVYTATVVGDVPGAAPVELDFERWTHVDEDVIEYPDLTFGPAPVDWRVDEVHVSGPRGSVLPPIAAGCDVAAGQSLVMTLTVAYQAAVRQAG